MSKIESIDDASPLADWLVENSKKILGAVAALLVLLFILFKLFSGAQAKTEKNYLEAESLGTKLFTSENRAQTAQELESLIRKLPDLEGEYDGLLAQTYLSLGEADKASPPLNRTLKRIASDDLPDLSQSSRIALLITEGKSEEAYEQATALKTQLAKAKNSLYYFNLFRLGMLAQALGKKGDEKKLWEEFISYSKASNPSFEMVVQAIDGQGVSLLTFIEQRQKTLN